MQKNQQETEKPAGKIILGANKEHPIYFVEGEKDADNLIRLGKCATTIIGKNNNADVWEKYQEQLRGAKIVFIGDTGEAEQNESKIELQRADKGIPAFEIFIIVFFILMILC